MASPYYNPTMFNPNGQNMSYPGQEDDSDIDPNVIAGMLRLSEAPNERADLERQRTMANTLGGKATSLQHPVGRGGPFAALAQGMQGYAAGSMLHNTKSSEDLLRERSKADRGSYLDAVMGKSKRTSRRPPRGDVQDQTMLNEPGYSTEQLPQE